jgi:methylmalonyl-CoA/ethylmalonyl-CoA epimerase
MKLENASIAQLLIPVADTGSDVAFYRDTFGIPFLFGEAPQMAFFDCGGMRLLVGVQATGQQAQRGSAIDYRGAYTEPARACLGAGDVRSTGKPHVGYCTDARELWLARYRDPDASPDERRIQPLRRTSSRASPAPR